MFDVEGVLIPKKRYLFFEVGRTLGFRQFVTIVLWGFLYEVGLISLKSALRHVFKAFMGIHVDELVRIFRQVPMMPGAEEQRQKDQKDTTPYWRTLKAGGVINEKYPGGVEVQKLLLEEEGHDIVRKGKKCAVADYEKTMASL